MNISTINKDTKIYGSFSKNAGNSGCIFFNNLFKKYNINAIYKSFSVSNIHDAYSAAQTLNFSGFAIAMPYKIEIMKYLDYISDCGNICGSVNTILFTKDRKSIGYNTDYVAAKIMLNSLTDKFNSICILGNGGLSKAVCSAAKKHNFDIKLIVRNNWNDISNLHDKLIFNCTPVRNITNIDSSNTFIDCNIGTKDGNQFHFLQASQQFKLYTSNEI
jgi:shikimate dehydrogenase